MRGKVREFFINAKSCDYNIIILTETWLTPDFLNSEILDNNWNIYRKDRNYVETNKTRGGGVLIAIHSSIPSEAIDLLEIYNSSDVVFAKIILKSKNVYLGSVYIPPSSSEDAYDKMLSSCYNIFNLSKENDDILVFGDYNRPNLDFIEDSDNPKLLLPINILNEIDSKIIQSFYGNNLCQVFNIKNNFNKYLDMCFTNLDCDFEVLEADNSSHLFSNTYHHKGMILKYDCIGQKCTISNNKRLVYNFLDADYININSKLSAINWNDILNHDDLDFITNKFDSIIHELIEQFVPKKILKDTNEPWLNSKLKNLRNKRNRAFKLFKKFNDAKSKDLYDNLANKFKNESLKSYDNYCKKFGQTILHDPKQFFKFVDMKRKSRGFPLIMHLNDESSSDAQTTSNLFAKNFQDIYMPSNLSEVDLVNFNDLHNKHEVISCLEFSHDEILDGLLHLDPNKGPGPDSIPSSFLLNCAYNLSTPLHIIFNHSLKMSKFPQLWKNSSLTPIYKSGNRNNIKNYRGIAIQSAFPKFFEKLICDTITSKINPLLNNEQHGFIKNRSTQTNLAIYTSSIINNIENGIQTDAIYTDFSKAFDRVNHKILLLKLERFGIKGSLLNWLKSYLTNRHQIVLFQNKLSNKINVLSGVPQGSHLGPLLFNIFISDLSSTLKGVKHLFYADDLKIFHPIKNKSDSIFLQSHIIKIDDWCKVNDIDLNIDKCSVISFTRKKTFEQYNYTLKGSSLQRLFKIRDLGVLLDTQLNFKLHLESITAKAYKTLSFIKRRASDFNNIQVTKTLYCSFVRSILEYCPLIWMPYQSIHIKEIESVQKQFLIFALRNIYNPRDFHNLPSYHERLKIIDLKTLESRRELLAACFIFDILKKSINIDYLNDHIILNNDVRQTRHSKFLKEFQHRTDYGKYEPINRGVILFNKFYKSLDNINFNKSIFKQNVLKIIV